MKHIELGPDRIFYMYRRKENHKVIDCEIVPGMYGTMGVGGGFWEVVDFDIDDVKDIFEKPEISLDSSDLAVYPNTYYRDLQSQKAAREAYNYLNQW